jgi:hypothetical protein
MIKLPLTSRATSPSGPHASRPPATSFRDASQSGVGRPARTTRAKVFEGLGAIKSGATNLDIVINVSRLKDDNIEYVRKELSQFVQAIRVKKAIVVMKIVVECYYLSHTENIQKRDRGRLWRRLHQTEHRYYGTIALLLGI